MKGKAYKSTKLGDGTFLHEIRGGNVHWYLSKLPLIGPIITLPVREIEWSLGFYRRLRQLKGKEGIDLIESSETGNFFTALAERSIPFVIRLHGSTYAFEKATRGRASLGAKIDSVLQRFSFSRSLGISAPSNFQKRALENERGCFPEVMVIPNPVSIDATVDSRSSKNGNAKTIFFAGRIADVKGVWPLLKAFVRIVKEHPEVRLVLAGASHVSVSSTAVRSFLADHRIADRVEFVGHIQRDKMGEYYERCTVYAVPSYYETFCISAIEAMLHGKAVIGSSHTALEEIIDDGVTGILVPPGDDKALSGALLRLLNDDALAGRMGGAGRQKALSLYRPQDIASKTLDLYCKVTMRNTIHSGS